jgi:hypothetical protein
MKQRPDLNTEEKVIVVVLPHRFTNYLTTFADGAWMKKNGFLVNESKLREREQVGLNQNTVVSGVTNLLFDIASMFHLAVWVQNSQNIYFTTTLCDGKLSAKTASFDDILRFLFTQILVIACLSDLFRPIYYVLAEYSLSTT